MRAAVLASPGLDNLRITELPEPRPGAGEVLVRIRAAALNYRDWVVAQGGYGRQQKARDLIPLSDGAGVVTAVGPGVTDLAVGDRVVGCFFPDWLGGEASAEKLAASLGGSVDGVAAEYRVFPAHALLRTPDYLSDPEAATLPCAAVTAWNALFGLGQVGPGQVVVTEGSGGVSVFALQLAVMAGAEVVTTSSSPEKLERLRGLGARHLVDYRAEPAWGDRVRALTGGRGADHVVDVGGAGTLPEALRAVRIGGTVSVIGVLAGGAAPLDVRPILLKGVRLQGIRVGSREHFAEMLQAMALHRLRPVLDRTFPLAELRAALEYLQAGRHVGKVTIEV